MDQSEELIGEAKARNGRLSRAILGGTGKVPFVSIDVSL